MSKNIKYNTISLKNETYSKLRELSQIVVSGITLSLPRTVEKLIHLASDDSEGAKQREIKNSLYRMKKETK